MNGTRCAAAFIAVTGLCAAVAVGRWASPEYIPAERLIQNATAYIQEHPGEADGYYTLGRIHYLAFINKAFLVGVFSDGIPPRPIPYWWSQDYLSQRRREEAKRIALEEYGYKSTTEVPEADRTAFWNRVHGLEAKLKAENWQSEQPSEEQLVGHAAAAQWNFYKAIVLDPNNGLYYLGQASLGEQYIEFLRERMPKALPEMVTDIILAGVRDMYFQAYEWAIDEDLSETRLPVEGLQGFIGYEAGKAYVRLWESEDQIPAQVQEKIDAVKVNLKTLEALPWGAITPVVFSTETTGSLAELLAPERIVRFDLDGDGVIEQRPWIKPTTGLLAWDSERDGRITSGRELFGSVTWWLFFSNGYRAMDVLDDNRYGLLTAGELKGISVWFDRDSDGLSDAGEVVSVESLGVAAIATRPTGRDGQSPMHEAGIRFRDGRTAPTYDWIAPAVRQSRGLSE
jgi:hypothetical protein